MSVTINDFKFIRSKMVMVFVHDGREYPIKKHKGKERWYIQLATGQLTVTELVAKKEYDYSVFYHYYLEGLQSTHPCLVMDWWMEMWRMKIKIPIADYMAKFNIHPLSTRR